MWGMTEPAATMPAPDSPRVSARLDDSDPPWPLRPWIMAAIGAVAGLIFYMLVDRDYDLPYAPWRDALAAFVAISTVVFLLGVERRRWHWALGFALLWGAVMGLITWYSAGYNVGGSPLEWPFWSGILAVLVATPLFQTRRDVAPDWRFWKLWEMPYQRLHSHAWTDAVIGAAALIDVGVNFLLVLLIGEMFHLIGINMIRDLLNDEWFGWMLAGAAFGSAVGLLRERDKLVSTLQRLVMIILSVLAPVLAAALVLFLLSLLGTGLTKLWDSGFSTAALMMAAAAFAVLLANAVIGNGREDRSANRLLHGAAAVLVGVVLPLAIIAAYSMHLRIIQYGWTPERIWGVIAAVVALAYGAAGLWAVVKGRLGFDELLRPLQQKLAIGLMVLAAFLALPIMDFGAISTRDQMARLKAGTTKVEKFDWAAMGFDFGPSGRAALAGLAKSPDKVTRVRAADALAAKDRWGIETGRGLEAADQAYLGKTLEEKVRVLPVGRTLPAAVYAVIRDDQRCRIAPCIAYWVNDERIAVVSRGSGPLGFVMKRPKDGVWVNQYDAGMARDDDKDVTSDMIEKGVVEVRTVQRRQIFIGGKPVADEFE